jgi:hypothetical protein
MNLNVRLPLMALAGAALLTALWAGLVRLGWRLPPLQPAAHGPLMISGFLGTLISLERAVALQRRWPYLAPLLSGLSGLVLLLGLSIGLAHGASVLGSLGLVAIFVLICRRRLDWAHLTMGLGAALWLVGNLLWAWGRPVFQAVPWWMGFLVLTIAGERLELARLVIRNRNALNTFVVSVGVFLSGLLLSLFVFQPGVRLGGLGLMVLGFWLLRYDLALRTIRQAGLTRFMAACLLPGYVWLTLTGGLWLVLADRFTTGPLYDAMLHTLLLGFVFSMIFGHAPIILPAVLNRAMTYRWTFYLPLALLHLSLIMRLASDLWFSQPGRLWGGLLNVIAVLIFLGNIGWAMRVQGEQ